MTSCSLVHYREPLKILSIRNNTFLSWIAHVMSCMNLVRAGNNLDLQSKIILFSDDLFQELDSKFQNVGKASAIDIDLVRFTSLATKTFLSKA